MFKPQIDISDATLYKEITNKLPAFKNQEDDSNNQKILSIIAQLFNDSKNNLLNISKLMAINNATGQNLTDIGKDYGVDRFDSDDDFLRFEIKWQILKANTNTDMNSIKTLISVLLNIPLTDFDILLTDNPEEIELVNIPFDFASGSHSEQKRQMLSDDLQSILPAETKLKDIQFTKQSAGTIYYAVVGTKANYNESEVLSIGNI